MGSEPQTLKDADRSETAKQLPGSGRSSQAPLVLVLLPVLVLPVLPLLAWRRQLAFSEPLSSVLVCLVLLCLVLLCLVLPSLVPLFWAPLFSVLASWRRPSWLPVTWLQLS